MPQATQIVLNTHEYNPRGTQNGVTYWSATMGDGAARATLTESVRGPLDSGGFRDRFVLSVPVVRSEDSACGCAGSLIGNMKLDVTVDLPGGLDSSVYEDFRLQSQALINHAVFIAAVDDQEGSWG